MLLKGKKIVLGVTGGIAVYKAVDLVSRLRKQGAEVRVVMTEHARQFVTPLTFKEISGNAVATSMWNSNQEFNVEHIALANWADVFCSSSGYCQYHCENGARSCRRSAFYNFTGRSGTDHRLSGDEYRYV